MLIVKGVTSDLAPTTDVNIGIGWIRPKGRTNIETISENAIHSLITYEFSLSDIISL